MQYYFDKVTDYIKDLIKQLSEKYPNIPAWYFKLLENFGYQTIYEIEHELSGDNPDLQKTFQKFKDKVNRFINETMDDKGNVIKNQEGESVHAPEEQPAEWAETLPNGTIRTHQEHWFDPFHWRWWEKRNINPFSDPGFNRSLPYFGGNERF